MSWKIGPCPTVFGCLQRESNYGLILAEIRKAIYERDQHATVVTGATVVPQSDSFFNRKDAGLDDADTIATMTSFKSMRKWVETYWHCFGDSAVTPMRGYRDTQTHYDVAATAFSEFLYSVLGYNAWKTSTHDLTFHRKPLQDRDIEELRMVIEKLQWGPMFYSECTTVGTTIIPNRYRLRYGDLVLKSYNYNGDPVCSDLNPAWSRAQAWANLLTKISAGPLDVNTPSYCCGIAGSYAENTLVWSGGFRNDGAQYRYSYGIANNVAGGWNTRAKIKVTPSKTGTLKITMGLENYRIDWDNGVTIPWDGTLYSSDIDPGASWYAAGVWNLILTGAGGADGPPPTQPPEIWTRYGKDVYGSISIPKWFEVRGWESALDWSSWNAPQLGGDPMKWFIASVPGIWERGDYEYGTPTP